MARDLREPHDAAQTRLDGDDLGRHRRGGRSGPALDRGAAARRGGAARTAPAARRRCVHRRGLSGARAQNPSRDASGHVFAGTACRRLSRAPGLSRHTDAVAATAIKAWTEIGESLARAGLRKLLLVTSHGGNVAAMELAARDLRTRLGMLAVTVGWHRFGYPEGTFSGEERRHGIHGGDIETSLMLAAMPDTVRTEKAAQATPATIAMAREFKWLGAYRPAGFAWMTQDLNATGAVGDATQASAAKGEAALAHGAQAFVELVREMDRFDLARLREGPLSDSAYDLSPRINR